MKHGILDMVSEKQKNKNYQHINSLYNKHSGPLISSQWVNPYKYFEFQTAIPRNDKNNVNADQLAPAGASWSRFTLFDLGDVYSL